MKKNKGFMLAETLIVTIFVAGILIYSFIQFNSLSKKYNDSYKFNNVEDLYSLRNISEYIESDSTAYEIIESKVTNNKYLNITDCSVFIEQEYCLKLFELENIKEIYVTKNSINKDLFSNFDIEFKKFISKINETGDQKYRLVVEFNDKNYATIRFGEENE